ncbi:hypothetical protein FIBSPDRAFT_946457 [Athelia psychrophila]|uniref:CCHC-type domain-containing protein n=1 Tax=Athelia psychrophila TaxID=1759441 RepID=A0A166SXP6_9AGAM|nr:hypothetical protein FIBSPDRAFT_946457 [Fibularhizoctonia sp. CBS 109695]
MATQQQPSVGLTPSQFAPGGFTTSTSSQLLNPFTPNLIPPISLITITDTMQDLACDTTFQKLSLVSDNYPIWCKRLHSVLSINNLDCYVDGTVLVPSSPNISQTDADSFWNYQSNCVMIIAYLKCYIDDTELAHIGTIDNPHTFWVFLANRHNKRGIFPVIRLLKTLFGYQFSADISTMALTLQNIRATNERIFDQSAITKDSLLICCIMNALEANHDNIRAAASSYYTSNPGAGSQWLFNRIATEIQFMSRVPAATQIICENKKCGKAGHWRDMCYQPGGGMEGKRGEVRRMVKEKKREGKHTRRQMDVRS